MSLIEGHLLLYRRRCDERRQYVAELERLAMRLHSDGRRLQAEIERADVLGNRAAAAPLIERQGRLRFSLAAIETQIGAAGAALAEAERELQRHEQAFAHRAPSERRGQARRPRRADPLPPGRDRGS